MKGLKRGTLELVPYSPEWANDFLDERKKLDGIFGRVAVAIEHVGSTAVPGLSAKPIIDIEVGLRDFSMWPDFIKQLEASGYTFMPDRVRADEVFLPKGPEERRTHYLHITQFGTSEWQGTLKFRDVLHEDKVLRDQYEQLKLRLARRFPGNRQAYSAGKEAFILKTIHIWKPEEGIDEHE